MSDQPIDELDNEGTLDDHGYEPPDSRPTASEFGTTAEEQEQGESFEQRLNQEVPDPDSAYGAPDDEGGLRAEPRAGGDEPDSIPAEQDFTGEVAVDAEADLDDVADDLDDDVADAGTDELGVLVADDEGVRADTDAELEASEVDGEGTSPEESAMHVVPD